MAQVEKNTRLAKEAQNAQLERNLRQADFQAVLAKLESDIKVLESFKPNSHEEALKHAKDMKYLRDRQATLE